MITRNELIQQYGFENGQRVYKIAGNGDKIEGVIVGARIEDEEGPAGLSVELRSGRVLDSPLFGWFTVWGPTGKRRFGHRDDWND